MEHDAYLKRKNAFEENEHKVHADLWEHSAKALKAKLEARSDFENTTHNNPINLLKSIKECSLSYEEDRHEMVATVDSFEDHFQRKQLNGESLLDCTRRFKVVREVLASRVEGPAELKNHVKDHPDCVEG